MAYTKDALKGKFIPTRPEKYVGNVSTITYRSSYELKFMKWCDLSDSVLKWGSEEVVIPYQSPVDGRLHRYFVDFFIKVRTKLGEEKKYLIEVKPYRFTQKPTQGKRKSARFLEEVVQYSVNQAKWQAARQFAKQVDAEFTIITEYDLGIAK